MNNIDHDHKYGPDGSYPRRDPIRWACIALIISGALTLLVETVGAVWIPEQWFHPVIETVAGIGAVVALIVGSRNLFIAYQDGTLQ